MEKVPVGAFLCSQDKIIMDVTLKYKMDKREMIRSVKNYLSQFGEIDKRVIQAIFSVDRCHFVPKTLINQTYEDKALPIESGQTISQPSTVARMLSLLNLKKGDKVLEVGTGSGWNAALIAYLVGKGGKVRTLEIHENLIESAKEKFEKLKIKNIICKKENFRKIKTKFDKIIFTAGIAKEEEKIIIDFAKKHLKDNGILVCPYQSGPLMIIKNEKGKFKIEYTEEQYAFVPLILRKDEEWQI